MTRKDLLIHITNAYGPAPDYPFEGDFTTAVFRHADNRKWFAIVMSIPGARLGRKDGGNVDVVNLKVAPEMLPSLWQEAGVYPAYHMNKNHWVTVALDGSAADELLSCLVGVSYDLTAKPTAKKKN